MRIIPLRIPEVVVLVPDVYQDDRGSFHEAFNEQTFAIAIGKSFSFVQDNQSHSKEGVVRGLHYQLSPYAQGKLVRVLNGAIFDVAVDLRIESPTFGEWVGELLTAHSHKQLWVPPGFAHGFMAVTDADVLYKTTDVYDISSERSIAWNDPDLNIDWPNTDALLSAKDKAAPFLRDVPEHDLFY